MKVVACDMRKIRAVVVLLGLALLLPALGCGFSEGPPSREEEFRQLVGQAKENAAMRRHARQKVKKTEDALLPKLRSIEAPGTDCDVAFGRSVMPIDGIVPIACGDFRRSWPFLVSFGFLRCETEHGGLSLRKVIFTTPRHVEYAVNGDAHSVGYQEITPILRREASGRTVGIESWIKRGLKLC